MSAFNKRIALMVAGIAVSLSGCSMMKGDDETAQAEPVSQPMNVIDITAIDRAPVEPDDDDESASQGMDAYGAWPLYTLDAAGERHSCDSGWYRAP